MPDPTPLRGKFVAFPNDGHDPEKPNTPAFRGKLSMPWEDMEHALTLWLKPTASGGTVLTGTIAPLPYEQMASMAGKPPNPCPPFKVGSEQVPVVVDHRGVILFKTRKTNEKQPDYYGWAHSGQPTRPAIKLAVWARNDDKGRVYLIGNSEEVAPPLNPKPIPEKKASPPPPKPTPPQPAPAQSKILKRPRRTHKPEDGEDEDEHEPTIG